MYPKHTMDSVPSMNLYEVSVMISVPVASKEHFSIYFVHMKSPGQVKTNQGNKCSSNTIESICLTLSLISIITTNSSHKINILSRCFVKMFCRHLILLLPAERLLFLRPSTNTALHHNTRM